MIEAISLQTCLCKHGFTKHTNMFGCYQLIPDDSDITEIHFTSCSCKKFQLDNLDYIEQLARERKLI